MLCKYKDLFGIPKQGIHAFRVFGTPVVDVLVTLVLAIIMSPLVDSPAFGSRVLLMFSIVYILSIFVHKLFCVKTNLTN